MVDRQKILYHYDVENVTNLSENFSHYPIEESLAFIKNLLDQHMQVYLDLGCEAQGGIVVYLVSIGAGQASENNKLTAAQLLDQLSPGDEDEEEILSDGETDGGGADEASHLGHTIILDE